MTVAPTPTPTTEQLNAVLDAAARVLEARADRMLTSVEWAALARAVSACRPAQTVPAVGDLVEPADACPVCSERRADYLVWRNDDTVECAMCGTVYEPGKYG